MTPKQSPRRRRVVPESADDDVLRELRSHLALRRDDLIADGWDPSEAEAEAKRALGDFEAVARACTDITRSHRRAVGRTRMFEAIWQDVRYGVRSLLGSPGFSVVALLTLALGIGANTAIFSVVNGVLLRPLPFEDPDELYWIDEVRYQGGTMSAAWANFVDWREIAGGALGMTAYQTRSSAVLGGAVPVRLAGANVSRDFWTVFPAPVAAGRLTVPDDHGQGAAPVVVVTRSLARDVLGAAEPREVVGRVIRVGGSPFEVVGVVDGFAFPDEAQFWIPMELTPQTTSRTSHGPSVVARVPDDVSLPAMEEALDAFQMGLATDVPSDELDYLGKEVRILPLRERLVGDARTALLTLLGAAGFVLLVACTNLASTLLARGTVRSREMAVRSALGGSRGRLVRQLLTESGVLAVLGALGGIALAAVTLEVLRSLGAGAIPRLAEVGIDGPVLLFTLAVAVVTALAFGLLPALRNVEGDQAGALRAGGRGNAGARGRTWGVLVTMEVALALVLLAGSGLLIRSFVSVLGQETGFDDGDVAVAEVTPGQSRYPALDDHVRFWDALIAETASSPGIEAAGLFSHRPLAFVPNGRLSLDGDPSTYGDGQYVVASPGAFEALDIRLRRGRMFDERDAPDAPHAVLVNQAFVDEYWPNDDPIGRQVSGGGMDNFWDADPVVFGTVVGVVDDVRYGTLERDPRPTVYWYYRQRPFRIAYGGTLVAESATGDPALAAQAIRSRLRTADAEIPVQVSRMSDLVSDSVGERRFMLFILGGFAMLALVLAGVGIYGVVSYSVARRTREMGVRLALGAGPASVRRLVLGHALRPVVLGLVLGVGGALFLSGLVQGFLFGVDPWDPGTFVGVTALLMAAAVLASWVPAFRGTRVDPIIAMRAE